MFSVVVDHLLPIKNTEGDFKMFRIRSRGPKFLAEGVTESTLFVKGNFPFISFPVSCPMELTLELSRSVKGLSATVLSWKPYPRKVEDLFHAYRTIGLDTDVADKLSQQFSYSFDFLSKDLVLKFPDAVAEKRVRTFIDYLRVAHAFRSGLTAGQYRTLVSFFRGLVWDTLQENPYLLLAFQEYDLEFVEELVSHLKVKPSPAKRMTGQILMVLREALSDGHTYVDRDVFMSRLSVLDGDMSVVSKALAYLESKGLVHNYQDQCLTLGSLFSHESNIATRIGFLSQHPSVTLDPSSVPAVSGYSWGEGQKQALDLFCGPSPLFTISGLPGTGKTSLVRAIVDTCKAKGLKYELLAPTGMAARRLGDLSKSKARTIHSFLGYDGQGFSDMSEVDLDVIIVDEMSMVDVEVFSKLISVVRKNSKLVLVGDDAQLPSVGPGAVYRDVLQVGLPGVRLTEIFRQAADNPVIKASHAIHAGDVPVSSATGKGRSFTVLEVGQDGTISLLKKSVVKLTLEGRTFQVMSPIYKGPLGIDALNVQLRSVLNPNSEKVTTYGIDLYMNDKVVFVENGVGANYYNGDFGTVVDKTPQGLTIKLDRGPNVTIAFGDILSTLRPGYCISVHRSQGSEYDVVLMALFESHGRMLERTLLYTGVTRAKDQVILFTTQNALSIAVGNNKAGFRKTLLPDLLKQQG